MGKLAFLISEKIICHVKVLHVTESMNAGVSDAILKIVDMYPECQHYLLYDYHDDSPLDASKIRMKFGEKAISWQGGWIKKHRKLRKLEKLIKPDATHLHSSIAGGIGRLKPKRNIVFYSPHNFAFERKDVSPFLRVVFKSIESLLSLNTDVFFVNWPIEYDAAVTFMSKKPVFFVPIVDFRFTETIKAIPHKGPQFDFISCGRLAVAKDPLFFRDIARILPDKLFAWIGGHGGIYREELEKAGVLVLDWKSKEDLSGFIFSAKALVITSRWESGPITLFQSLSHGTPVVVRSQVYSNKLGISSGSSIEDLSTECFKIATDDNYRSQLLLVQRSKVERVFEDYLLKARFLSYSSVVSKGT